MPLPRPGEVAGTREISDAERQLIAKYGELFQPLPRDHKPATWRDIYPTTIEETAR